MSAFQTMQHSMRAMAGRCKATVTAFQRGGGGKKDTVRGRGWAAALGGNYLVDDGLGECLTHVVRYLGGLVGKEGKESEGRRGRGCEHRIAGSVEGGVWGYNSGDV